MTEQQAVLEKPAFEREDVQQALQRARKVRMSFEPVDKFIGELKDMKDRAKDFLVPFKNLKVVVGSTPTPTEDGVEDGAPYSLMLMLDGMPDNGGMALTLYEHVLGQLCGLTSIGEKAGMPVGYLKRLLSDSRDKAFVHLAAANVNELLSRRYGEKHTRGKVGEEKAIFVRTFRMKDGSLRCRALLSDRYFPIHTLDMVTIALGLATGKIKPKDDGGDSAITGAFVFDKHLSVTGCTVGFLNPAFAFDLRNPDQGIIHAERVTQGDNGQPVFHYPGGAQYALGGRYTYPADGPQQHLVMPAARISNSETGGGSAEVQPMLFEGACTNGSVFAQRFGRAHHGSIMEEANEFESNETKKKKMDVVISTMTDALRQVFSVNSFAENCRKFLKLTKTELKSDRVKEVTDFLLSAIPGADGLLDDIMKAYQQFIPGRDTVLDVQRAITNVAQDQPYERQAAMEELGGSLIAGETEVPERFVVGTAGQSPWTNRRAA